MDFKKKLYFFDQYFTLDRLLGKGNYGEAWKIISKENNDIYALKLVPYSRLNPFILQSLHIEGNIIKGKLFDNVITYYGFYFIVIEDNYYAGILMEYFKGITLYELGKLVDKEKGSFSDRRVLNMMKQAVHGLVELHFHNIVHRDIKLENILWDGQTIKLIDLGFSCSDQPRFQCKGFKGTPLYLSPEFIQLIKNQPEELPLDLLKASDIWALGITFFWLVNGDYPFIAENIKELTKNILDNNRQLITPNPDTPKTNYVIELCFYPFENRLNALQLYHVISQIEEER